MGDYDYQCEYFLKFLYFLLNNLFSDVKPNEFIITNNEHEDNVFRKCAGRKIFPIAVTNATGVHAPSWMRALYSIMIDENLPLESRILI